MNKKVGILKSIRTKLFISLCTIVIWIVIVLILLNNFVLKQFYEFTKKENLKTAYNTINEYYYDDKYKKDLSDDLDELASSNNFDILINDENTKNVYTSSKEFYSMIGELSSILLREGITENRIMEKENNHVVFKFKDGLTNVNYIILVATLDNGYNLYMRVSITEIDESIQITNDFLYIIGIFIILFGGIIVFVISRRFSEPVVELNEIAKDMSNLDFSKKYKTRHANDEIDMLGESINILSDKLRRTIKQLQNANVELEKDVEEKSQIDEMRKSFISDVSHELKTPVALIQGYSEGLLENVNTDEESRKYYANVILDEATKMDILVKQLLELMKLEYGKQEFNNKKFNIVDLEEEILRKTKVMMQKENIELVKNIQGTINVYADDFYIDQVLTNYIMNAIKYSKEVEGEKIVKIENEIIPERNVVRIKVFNTYDLFTEEDMFRIWNRFYKVDKSRHRENGGNGIGLSLVKAIMNNYDNDYGVRNVDGGVEFYFELNLMN